MRLVSQAIEKYHKDGLSEVLIKGTKHIYMLSNHKIKNLERKLKNENVQSNGIWIEIDCYKDLHQNIQRALINEEMDNGTIELINEYIPKEVSIIELGAGIGLVSCYINKHITEATTQIVLEPNETIIQYLSNNKEINNANFEIKNMEYSSSNDNVNLKIGDAFWGASTVEDESDKLKSVEVTGVNLCNIADEYAIEEFCLITNMEGGEYDLLLNETEMLREKCNTMIIGFHRIDNHNIDNTVKHLENNGFEHVDTKGNKKYLFQNQYI